MKLEKYLKIIIIALIFTFVQATAFADEILYKEGDDSLEVAKIQQQLNKQGFYKKNITGKYDKNTTKAIKNFQNKKGLPETGQIDEITYNLIYNKESSIKKVDPTNDTDKNYKGNNAIVKTANNYLNTPYVFGGATPKGFDCSGFVMYVFEKNNIILPRTADVQFKAGKKVDKSQLKDGDLVFFTTYEPGASHVGIYCGKNKFIHASSSKGVIITDLNGQYWKERYLGARRIK